MAPLSRLSGRPAVTISAFGSRLLIAAPTVRSMLRYCPALGFGYQYCLIFGSFQICHAVMGRGVTPGLPCHSAPFGPYRSTSSVAQRAMSALSRGWYANRVPGFLE